MKITFPLIALLASLAAPAAVDAQNAKPQPANPPRQGAAPMPGLNNANMNPGEIQKLFDAYLVMDAQQTLTLTDAQYPKFLTHLKNLQETRRRNQQARNQLMGQLQKLTNPKEPRADDKQIKFQLTALHDLEARHTEEMRKAYAALDEVLDVRQQARFRVFEEQIERRKMDLLMRARQQNRAAAQKPPNPSR
jgi:hypothetical protein